MSRHIFAVLTNPVEGREAKSRPCHQLPSRGSAGGAMRTIAN